MRVLLRERKSIVVGFKRLSENRHFVLTLDHDSFGETVTFVELQGIDIKISTLECVLQANRYFFILEF